MKKLLSITVSVVVAVSLFVGCSKDDKYKTQYERDQAEYNRQVDDNSGSDAAKYAATTGAAVAGGTAGGAVGIAGGAAAGAAIGSVVPGLGTAVGAAVGAVVGGLSGAVAGGTKAGSAAYSLVNGEVSEYINVETDFIYSGPGSYNGTRTFAFSSLKGYQSRLDPRIQASYEAPEFQVRRDVNLTINMLADMIPNKAKKASKRQKSEDLLIPVEVQIDKCSNLSVSYTGGAVSEDAQAHYEIGNTSYYHFYIKNNPYAHPSMVLRFTPAEAGLAYVRVIYGKPSYKIVMSSCDVKQTIYFVE